MDRQREHQAKVVAVTCAGGITGNDNSNGKLILCGAPGDPSQWDKKTVAEFIRLLAKAFGSKEEERNRNDARASSVHQSRMVQLTHGRKTSKPATVAAGGNKEVSSTKAAKAGDTASSKKNDSGKGEGDVDEWVGAFRLNGAQLCALSASDMIARVKASPRSQEFAALLASSTALLQNQSAVGGSAALTSQHGGVDVGALALEASRNMEEKANGDSDSNELKSKESGNSSSWSVFASTPGLEKPRGDRESNDDETLRKPSEPTKLARPISKAAATKVANKGGSSTKTSTSDTAGGVMFGRASIAAFERLATLTASVSAPEDRSGSSDSSTAPTIASVSAAWSGAVEELAALRDLAAAAKKALSRQTTRHKVSTCEEERHEIDVKFHVLLLFTCEFVEKSCHFGLIPLRTSFLPSYSQDSVIVFMTNSTTYFQAAVARRVSALSSSLTEGQAALAAEHASLTLLHPAHRRALAHVDAFNSASTLSSPPQAKAPTLSTLSSEPPKPPKRSLFSWTKGSKWTAASATATTSTEEGASEEHATSSGEMPAEAPPLTDLTRKEALILSNEVSSFDEWAALHGSALHVTTPSKAPLPSLDCLDRAQEALDAVTATGALSKPANAPQNKSTGPDASTAATASALALQEASASADAIASRQAAFRSRDAEDKAAEKAFVATRDELESLLQV